MITRVIYDTKGLIISQTQGSDLPVLTGVPYLDIEIPEGKYMVRIDTSVTPNVPVYGDIPKSDIQILKEKINVLETENISLKSKLESIETDDLEMSTVVLDLLYLSDKGAIV